jgi:hypothetical protein
MTRACARRAVACGSDVAVRSWPLLPVVCGCPIAENRAAAASTVLLMIRSVRTAAGSLELRTRSRCAVLPDRH